MELSKQVTSLELSKRLKELVKQNSYFWWTNIYKDGWKIVTHPVGTRETQFYSAFTVAELASIVTPFMDSDGFRGFGPQDIPEHLKLDDKNMFTTLFSADYLAELIIYLLENNLIKL